MGYKVIVTDDAFEDLDNILYYILFIKKSYLISILLTAGCYFGSLWLLRRKVKKVDMIESLKDNRE